MRQGTQVVRFSKGWGEVTVVEVVGDRVWDVIKRRDLVGF